MWHHSDPHAATADEMADTMMLCLLCCAGSVDVNISDSFQAVARGLEWLNFQVALVGSAAASTIPQAVPDFDVAALANVSTSMDVSGLVQGAVSLQDKVRRRGTSKLCSAKLTTVAVAMWACGVWLLPQRVQLGATS